MPRTGVIPRLTHYRDWGWVVIFLASFLVFFRQRIDHLLVTWVSDGIYSLCPFVPLISGGLVYLNRDRLKTLPAEPSSVGIALVALCIGMTVWFDYRVFGYLVLTPALMALTLAGMVLALRGWATLREVGFPLAFLLVLLPVPPSLMFTIDYPLQTMCARATAGLGSVVGLGLHCAGAQVLFPDPDLSVAVAPGCNGLRSTVALLAISSVYAYLLKGKWYKRSILVAAAIPLAYVGNFLRLLGIVGILSWAGSRILNHVSQLDACLGLVAFAVPLTLLFLLARWMGCREFQHIG